MSDVVSAGETHDPYSNEEFVFSVSGMSYRLYSKGTKFTGPITLKYDLERAAAMPAKPPL